MEIKEMCDIYVMYIDVIYMYVIYKTENCINVCVWLKN